MVFGVVAEGDVRWAIYGGLVEIGTYTVLFWYGPAFTLEFLYFWMRETLGWTAEIGLFFILEAVLALEVSEELIERTIRTYFLSA